MTDDLVVFNNDNYVIKVDEVEAVYVVVNKETKVVEAVSIALPKAILTAEEYNKFLLGLKKKGKTNENPVITLVTNTTE